MSRAPHALVSSVLLPALLLLAAGCASGADPSGTPAETPAKTEAQPAASEEGQATREEEPHPAEALDVETLAGELVMTKLAGPVASDEELETVRRLQVGGIILFGPSVTDPTQLRSLLQSLDQARAPAARQAGLHPRLLVSVDQEGGAIRNVPFAPPELTQPAIAAAGSVERARALGIETGRALRSVGISMDLGPVADLAAGPNRTMAGRAFGSDPQVVAPYVRATVEGLQRGGVAAVAKHFPGFGASTANSDEAVAYVDRSLAELRREELVPFRAAIDGGTHAIMVSHGIHRSLGSSRPGTLDPRIATRLLREELDFDGVAVTDSMNARGFREAWGDTVPRACPVALAAGMDLLLLTGTMETARLCRDRIIDAVADGTLAEARVREAARRVIDLRAQFAPAEAPA